MTDKKAGELKIFPEWSDPVFDFFNDPFKLTTSYYDIYEKAVVKALSNVDPAQSTTAAHVQHYIINNDGARSVVSIDIPGVKPEDIDVTREGDKVTVTTKRGGKMQAYEHFVHHDYDAGLGEACLEHGVLRLIFPKKTATKSRKINVVVK